MKRRSVLDRARLPRVAVARVWPGETVICLGGGPSLTVDDVASVRGRARVIAVNDAYRLAPWADVLYAADAAWWKAHHGVPEFAGAKYSLERGAAAYGAVVLENTGNKGLELAPTGLRTGRNSGYQAINLAVHFGAARILLLGYDMDRPAGSASHWFGEHAKPLVTTSADSYQRFRDYFATIVEPLRAAGVEVINCSRRTALTVFPWRTLDEVIG